MQDILTMTLNPAVDMSTAVDHVAAGPKLRCDRPAVDPGGGGINVSRAIRTLGGQTRALVAVGGSTGKTLRHLLLDEGIAYLPFRAPGETRQSLAVTDRDSGAQYRFVLPGPDWSAADVERLLDMIPGIVPDGGFVVPSGSLPPGVPPDFIARLCALLSGRDVRVVADVSGTALEALVARPAPGLDTLRMDQHEAETLRGTPLPTRTDTAGFARALVGKGVARTVIVARGADGSVLATAATALHAAAADVPVQSRIGAGDSFVGAYTLALALGADPGTALQRGAAAASAAVMTGATDLCTRADAERLLTDCPLTVLG
ncbi:1-phosphofructokinase family hexose kinase [Shimia sp. FJ5]|uniref:1-phosphofructokinase family hexose kinase n=1 Tax=Shimia sp. FJ5 TaxID=3079054 RepID=UPI0026049A50|nr:1-phosphofructokinase family hexose kinase [Shimia sp. FJ5]MDV4145117.1 1-phosphofructokinase family hexose kinase [Shimia sp. FJ5]